MPADVPERGLALVIRGSATAAVTDFGRFDPGGLRAELHRLAPAILAFDGRKAAQVFPGRLCVVTGLRIVCVGSTRLLVDTSTNGVASVSWDFRVWQKPAQLKVLPGALMAIIRLKCKRISAMIPRLH
jgi:hypothetical protein